VEPRSGKPLRCGCSRRPILAFYGRDRKGALYVHIKIYKARRIYGEVLTTSGNIKIRCRECLRWYTVTINPTANNVKMEESDPVRIADEDNAAHG